MDQSTVEFVLDTDIGTDADDILALSVALGSPELTITAVTTVYGDVRLRARLAAHTFACAGVTVPPIVPGIGRPRSGRPVWSTGHEGKNLPPSADWQRPAALDAVQVLAAAPVVAAIGPLTNLAAALERPRCGIERIVLMGGDFRDGSAEYNMVCDLAAAEAVFGSGTTLTAVGLDQTQRLRITEATFERLRAGSPLSELLEAEVRQWWAFAGEEFNIPHDPIAIMALARPDLFEVTPGRIRLDTDGPHPGRTVFEPDPGGPHTIVVDFDLDRVAEEIATRLSRATSISAEQRI